MGERTEIHTAKYPLDGATEKRLKELFTYHKPFGDQPVRFEKISVSIWLAAQIVCENVPPGVQRDRAIEFLVQARMMANAGIACNEEDGVEIAAGYDSLNL